MRSRGVAESRYFLRGAAIAFLVFMPASPALGRNGSPSGGPTCPAPCSDRNWNSTAIDYQAKRISIPGTVAGNYAEVGTWNAYLRLALIGNQDPTLRMYRNTYARCWSPSGWAKASKGNTSLMGFYQPGSAWVNVPVATCRNAAKAARGELSPTNVVALGTMLHETFHRQGVVREDDATCLAALSVWQAANRRTTAAQADRAWQLVIDWYSEHLSGVYRSGIDGCRERGVFAWNDTRVWR
jgi:hypothetical protein